MVSNDDFEEVNAGLVVEQPPTIFETYGHAYQSITNNLI